jgi:toxin-antitoxin system PIN domain toxin
MQMPDVNVLVYAHREESPDHQRYADWLIRLATGPEPFALSELVIHGFLRIVTSRRIFDPPSNAKQALLFIENLLTRPTCKMIRPGPRHWTIFRELCETANLRGPMVSDGVHAALAIETGCQWVTADTDFARFAPRLRWSHL